MDLFYRLFDLFVAAAHRLASYIPQSGEDVMRLLGYVLHFALAVNNWIAAHLGVNIKGIFSVIGGVVISGIHYFIDIIKNLANRA